MHSEADAIAKREWLGIPPDELVNRIAQISLDTYELGGPHIFIPPVLVTDYRSGKHSKTGFSKVSFLGTVLGQIEGCPEEDSEYSRIRTITFFNVEPDLQPQFLIDADFLRYLGRYGYSVPVRVYGSLTLRKDFAENEEADSDAFFYVGWGTVQIFRPGKGFDRSWNKNNPWYERLRGVEAELLEKYSA